MIAGKYTLAWAQMLDSVRQLVDANGDVTMGMK
jgi:hypothetical protein